MEKKYRIKDSTFPNQRCSDFRSLKTAPHAKGLAVPGMPAGSPGMEGSRSDSYDVVLIDEMGGTSVYQKYP